MQQQTTKPLHASPTGPCDPATAYPAFPSLVPGTTIKAGRYCARYALNAEDLDAVLRLRYEVFNLELKEGLQASHETGRDQDDFDAHCHHLMVTERDSGRMVGTYRLQTHDMARAGNSFYSATEYDLSGLPDLILNRAIELGRACIQKDHRHGRVLYLLWRGLLEYIRHNRKRYLFGCCSLSTQDMRQAQAVYAYLQAEHYTHPDFLLRPLPAYACTTEQDIPPAGADAVPLLMRLYLENNAKICSLPAIDRVFKTIDYLMLFDLEELPAKTLNILNNTH